MFCNIVLAPYFGINNKKPRNIITNDIPSPQIGDTNE
jgi:hypothetical protein